jgi:hypothetical protein
MEHPRAYHASMATNGIEVGFLLDRQWHALRGEMESTKRLALVTLARVLEAAGTPYAIIGGIALQIHQSEPRTTLDIDLAISSFDVIPRQQLQEAGFTPTGQVPPSENWLGPERVPVQFTADPALAPALDRAIAIDLADVRLRVIARADLLHEKLRAGSDPARRRSKRLQDLADVEAILEETPDLRTELSQAELAILDSLPS